MSAISDMDLQQPSHKRMLPEKIGIKKIQKCSLINGYNIVDKTVTAKPIEKTKSKGM